MYPICFYIGDKPIYWYGVLVALAFLCAVINWNILSPRLGYPRGFGSDLGFWVMLAGIIGARLAYILSDWNHYVLNPREIIRIDQGGLIYYGGFIGGVLAVVLVARLKKTSLAALTDFGITGVALGHAIGRLGCFMNGCCYGEESTVPWAVFLHDLKRHPTQLYEAVSSLVIYVILLRFIFRKKRDGTVLALYLTLYPVARFLVEFIRGDDRMRWAGLTVAQDLSILFFVAGLVLWMTLPADIRTDDSSSGSGPSDHANP